MQIIIDLLIFLIGIHLTMQLIAALYRIIDLWYRIEDFLLPIARSILLYTLSILFIWWQLEERNEDTFLWGCIFFLCFHIGGFWIAQAIFKIKWWRQE